MTNCAFHVNKELDAMFDKGVVMVDGSEREKWYNAVWDLLNKELPWVPLVEMQTLYRQHKDVKGIDHAPGIMNYYAGAYFDTKK